MTKKEYLSEFSEFYHIDEDGCTIDIFNQVHTIFQLRGSKDAFAAAAALVNDALLNPVNVYREFDYVKSYTLGDIFCIEIRTNNFIPQLYDALKAIEGIEAINYAVYDAAYGRMITDHESMGNAIKRAHQLDVEIEVDDEPDMFPTEFELSLPDLNDAD